MQIVIDIPEDYYKVIKEIPVEQSTADMLIIKNGAPLPKGHGRIVDENIITEVYVETIEGEVINGIKMPTRFNIIGTNAPTITEADSTPHESVTEFADRCRECGREKVLDKIRAEIDHLKWWSNGEDYLISKKAVKCILAKYIEEIHNKKRG